MSSSLLLGQGVGLWKVYAFHIFLLLSLPSFFKKFCLKFQLTDLKDLVLPFMFLLLGSLTLFWSQDRTSGFFYLIQFGIGFYYLIYVKVMRLKFESLLKSLNVIYFLNLLISFFEGVSLFRYPLSQYSSVLKMFFRSYSDVDSRIVDWPTGFHWNPNNNGLFIITFAPIVYSKLKEALKVPFLCIVSFVVFKITSKLILLFWIGVCLYLLIIELRKRSSIKVLFIAATFVVVSLVSFLSLSKSSGRYIKYTMTISSIQSFAGFLPHVLKSSLENKPLNYDFSGKDISLHERIMYVEGVLRRSRNDLFLGLGVGSLKKEFFTKDHHSVSLATPHLYALELVSNFGILISLLYVAWVLQLLFISYHVPHVYLVSLTVFYLASASVSSIHYFLPQWFLFSLILQAPRIRSNY